MRSFNDSQKRFDNSMDALSVMDEHVPGFRPYAKALVDRTNTVRKAEPGHKNYVDLSQYGVERAKSVSPERAAIGEPSKDFEGPYISQL